MGSEESQRIPTMDDTQILDSKWQKIPHMDTTNNTRMTNGQYNGVPVICTGKDVDYKWPPLLKKDTLNDSEKCVAKTRNNNEWDTGGTEKQNGKHLGNNKYTYWSSNCDDNGNGNLKKLSGNNNGSLINNKALLGNGNIEYPAELESLTGKKKENIDIIDRPDLDEISQCGLGSCQPRWARSFASTHCFMVVFLIAWVSQGMYYTYFVSMITTIEKLFQIKSKTTGLLMSAVEIGQICTSLFLTYYAGRGHRPRWIACGMVLYAIASFGCTLPHFIFGDKLLEAHQKLSGHIGKIQEPNVSYAEFTLASLLSEAKSNLCRNNLTGEIIDDGDLFSCNQNLKVEQDNQSYITSLVLGIFTICLLTIGVGQTAISTLGIPYIDDNVASRESPIYIAITIGVRILGPAAGFILGSFCTRIYVYPNVDPGVEPTDAQWVGAWWLGLLLVSSCMGLASFAMFMFPRNLKGNRIPPPEKMRAIEAEKKLEMQQEESAPKFKDFPKTIKRQLNNDILMFRTASSVLHLLPVAGLYTFLPKYMETQFNLAAHDANLISGVSGILVMGVGIVISGVIILKVSPTAKSVAGWIAFTAIVYSIGMGILMFIGCPMSNLAGYEEVKAAQGGMTGSLCTNVTSCECAFDNFEPICGADGVTYFSSCHAGCSDVSTVNNKLLYSNCSCLAGDDNPFAMDLDYGQAKSGFCDGHCQSFVIFISLFSFVVFMHSTGEVGGMLLIMRCTDPKDKAMAMGVIQFAIGIFGNVPCPIIYGAVVDSACMVWESVCDKVGACSLYDGDTFRHFFLGATSGIMFLAFIMDLVVWRKADRIAIDPESSSNSETEYEKTATAAPESTV